MFQDKAGMKTASQMDRKFISVDLQQENTQDSITGSVLVKLDGEAGIEMVHLER